MKRVGLLYGKELDWAMNRVGKLYGKVLELAEFRVRHCGKRC